jgi:hypothetical protein
MKERARPGDAVTGVCRRLCGTTGTAAMSKPLKLHRNALSMVLSWLMRYFTCP